MWWVVFHYVQSVGALTGLGLGCALRAQVRSDELLKTVVVNAIVRWSVAMGATEAREWPPLMGPLKDAWRVRQMWR
jgi:hypothetical protein